MCISIPPSFYLFLLTHFPSESAFSTFSDILVRAIPRRVFRPQRRVFALEPFETPFNSLRLYSRIASTRQHQQVQAVCVKHQHNSPSSLLSLGRITR
ncbi:hypothetical protein C8R43DRAFT_552721 [Mycena crocata]|nr:hypothetical protein C8R43DRAFT_552721 [Mycena crocata]